ncbi:MAG: SpoVA/SpoVAEb family sporulation membrane protein [Oscillospiraceae bacterium]|nr:SpoVA/SpoVAEb family sporulation membrane protein [Oscillospiraceae bacterium]
MKMTKTEYQEYIKSMVPKSPLGGDLARAFVVGGLICALGQGLTLLYGDLGEDAPTAVSITLVFLSALMTGLGLYDRLARFGGAGTLVPITGFANAVAAPALEFKTEGVILGTAVKMFTIAGPVITFGLAASAAYGLILCLLT